MSIGGAGLHIEYEPNGSGTVNVADREPVKKKNSIKEVIVPVDQVSAYIDPAKCINCGTCRETCPAGAITENQRVICHGCPICTDKPGLSPQDQDALATTCSCTTACPLGISPQGYVGLTRAGKTAEAFNIIWEKNPLPSVCGSVCHHPCEDACKRGIIVDSPIKIRALKKYLAEMEAPAANKYKVLYDEKIAVIGAGPAGLTAAHYLAQAGYEAVVFESSAEAGGMLKRGIPEFRLSRTSIDRDIQRLRDAGLDIRLDSRIDKFTFGQIRAEYDAIIVATGAPNSKELKIPGFRLAGVMSAMNFMEHVNHNLDIRRHLGQIFNFKGGEAVVVGGGSVAIDVARAAIRAGASKVTMVCLECGCEIPAHPWELAEAREEGIILIEGYSPIEYKTDLFPELKGVKLAKVRNFSKDESGRISFDVDRNDTMEIKADWVVEAIGQGPDAFWKSLEGSDIFFAGDVASNKCSVVDAMASGRKTAIIVDAALRGRKIKDPMEAHSLTMAPVMEKIFPYNRRKIVRPDIPLLDAEIRVNSFDEVEGVLTGEQASQEVLTCLSCGYEVIDPEKCLACGICVRLCPKGDVITMVAKGGSEQ